MRDHKAFLNKSNSHSARKLRNLIQIAAPGVLALSAYRPSWLPKDLAAGLSVAAIALPVGIAYADLAGVPPVIGMYSAIFPLFAYALFGSSRQLMTGPDAATCILVAATLGPLAGGDAERYATLLLELTVISGLLYLFAGVAKLGFLANFLADLRLLYRMSYREFLMSVGTTVGVLVLGVLPGVLLAVALSLLWLLSVGSRPNDSVLGRVQGQKGFHSASDYPDAMTIPGLLLYRFDSNVVFYNADYLKTRVRAAVAAQKTPVEWVVFDASAVNVIDATGLRKLDELREELAAAGVTLYVARVKRHLERFFNEEFAKQRRKTAKPYRFQTLKQATKAYLRHQRRKGLVLVDRGAADPESDDREWREHVESPRMENQDIVPAPPAQEEPTPPA